MKFKDPTNFINLKDKLTPLLILEDTNLNEAFKNQKYLNLFRLYSVCLTAIDLIDKGDIIEEGENSDTLFRQLELNVIECSNLVDIHGYAEPQGAEEGFRQYIMSITVRHN